MSIAAGAGKKTVELVHAGKAYHCVDFDDHLDDITKDWCNPGLCDL